MISRNYATHILLFDQVLLEVLDGQLREVHILLLTLIELVQLRQRVGQEGHSQLITV